MTTAFDNFMEDQRTTKIFAEIAELPDVDVVRLIDDCLENMIGECHNDAVCENLIRFREGFWDKVGYGAGRLAGGLGNGLAQGFARGQTAAQNNQARKIAGQAIDTLTQAYTQLKNMGLGRPFRNMVVKTVGARFADADQWNAFKQYQSSQNQAQQPEQPQPNAWQKGLQNMKSQQAPSGQFPSMGGKAPTY